VRVGGGTNRKGGGQEPVPPGEDELETSGKSAAGGKSEQEVRENEKVAEKDLPGPNGED